MNTPDRAARTAGVRTSLDDGHGDAFRHIYWNARMTQEFGPEWTETCCHVNHDRARLAPGEAPLCSLAGQARVEH